jgi:hypothetical protein
MAGWRTVGGPSRNSAWRWRVGRFSVVEGRTVTTWYAVFADGHLVSIGTVVADDLDERGFTVSAADIADGLEPAVVDGQLVGVEPPTPVPPRDVAAEIDALVRIQVDTLTETGVVLPWRQPTGAHDAFPPGVVVEFDGDRWRNDLGVFNVWPPTEPHARWTNLDAPEPGVGWVPGVWVSTGEIRTYQGAEWRVVQGHTTQVGWEPSNVAALWQPVV